ncbi:metalloregulator ArsR/SmtB family transcription factor [Actinoplanes sp. NPDC049596]|uniref:ArsR/SmtB family transcription factor n=1 Tax=unclassified Actinoplanes TaxID=2626549 RepID=UPI00342ED8C8
MTHPDDDVLERAVTVLRGMAYEHRLRILIMLRAGERSPAEIAAAVPADPTAVAHHLRFLLDARLIRRRRRGRQVFYTLTGETTAHLVTEVMRYAGGD